LDFSSDDDLPLSHHVNQSAFDSDTELKSSRLKKTKIDIENLRNGLKQFGEEMEKKLDELIFEAKDVLTWKIPKEDRKKVECPLCGDKYFEILGHLLRHTSRPPFNCDQCNRSFTFKGKLLDHRKFAHGINYACDICNKVSR